jgi:hypothetical protein
MFEALRARMTINALVLPLVFDDTREQGIREDIARALDDAKVRSILETDDAGRAVVKKIDAMSLGGDAKGAATLQQRSESAITAALESCCRWEAIRGQARGWIWGHLYRTRNTVFGIKPTSARRKIASTYDSNLAAYESMLRRARASGVRVIAYVSPLRSDAPRPYNASEYAAFKADVERIARSYQAVFLDLENLVPNRYWGSKDGTSMDGTPEIDFMHFQFDGHRLLATKLATVLERVLP